MSGQTIAVLALTQVAILVAAALAAWTCYGYGYQRGWDARHARDPFVQLRKAMQAFVRQVGQSFTAIKALTPAERDRRDMAALRARYTIGTPVRDPEAFRKITTTGA